MPGEGLSASLRHQAFLVYLLYLTASYISLDMTVLPNNLFQPHTVNGKSVINSYVLSVKNKGKANVEVHVKVSGIEGDIKVSPDKSIYLKSGEIKKFPVFNI